MVRYRLLVYKVLFTLFGLLTSPYGFGLVVLQYHHVSDRTPKITSVSPSLFKAHMEYLEKHEFNVLDIRSLHKILASKQPLPDRSVIITFDDGYRSIYQHAYPELKKRKWPFAVFVNSKAHDSKLSRYMSWGELKELDRYGATIANHTDGHIHVNRRRSGESHKAWRKRRIRELEFAESRIQKEIGAAYRLFAYPYGEYDSDFMKELKRRGYLAFGQQSGAVGREVNPQLIPRFPFGGIYGGMDDFKLKVNSLPFPSAKVRIYEGKGADASGGRQIDGPVLPEGELRPVLQINSPVMSYLNGVSCFATGQGQLKVKVKGSSLIVRAHRPLPVGRSRYNCTATAGGGRFYWISQLFVRRKADGTWLEEL